MDLPLLISNFMTLSDMSKVVQDPVVQFMWGKRTHPSGIGWSCQTGSPNLNAGSDCVCSSRRTRPLPKSLRQGQIWFYWSRLNGMTNLNSRVQQSFGISIICEATSSICILSSVRIVTHFFIFTPQLALTPKLIHRQDNWPSWQHLQTHPTVVESTC